MYATADEARFRLEGTVVLYEGHPYYVLSAEDHEDGTPRISITPHREGFRGGAAVRKKVNSPLFRRFVTPELGYTNFFSEGSTNASWAERLPVRRSRQGLCAENVSVTDPITGYRHNWNSFSRSAAFLEMIENRYPSFDEAMGRLVPGSSIAVSRNFALAADEGGITTLVYKKGRVGLVFRGGIYVHPSKQFLLETITEEPNLPNVVEVM